jgi:nucleoid-associated protein YgaU
MAIIRRYTRAPILTFGKKFGTSKAILAIRTNIKNGNIRTKAYILSEGERLDILAGTEYGDGTLWWLIACASNIGFAAQVPPGTILRIPILEDAVRFVG